MRSRGVEGTQSLQPEQLLGAERFYKSHVSGTHRLLETSPSTGSTRDFPSHAGARSRVYLFQICLSLSLDHKCQGVRAPHPTFSRFASPRFMSKWTKFQQNVEMETLLADTPLQPRQCRGAVRRSLQSNF